MDGNEKLDLILSEMQDMKADMQDLKGGVQAADRKITDIHLMLENEIRVNIQRVAEGHLDLSRNLHEAMKPSNEVEMLSIKVRKLESDMREVKTRLSLSQMC